MKRNYHQQEIVNKARAHMSTYAGTLQKACPVWALAVIHQLNLVSEYAIIQAGSAFWPRMLHDDSTSPLYFGYQWEPNSLITLMRIVDGIFPEMHVWVALPKRNEIIDVTTCYLTAQCKELTGLSWDAPEPPNYLWTDVDLLPPGVRYTPSLSAIKTALNFLAVFKAELPAGLRPAPSKINLKSDRG